MRVINLDMFCVESIRQNNDADTMLVCTHHSLQSSSGERSHSFVKGGERESMAQIDEVENFTIICAGISALILSAFLIWLWAELAW